MIFRTSGIKPMSSIRSASSMTSTSSDVVSPLKVEQPSRGCYDDIDRVGGKLFSLFDVIHTSKYGNDFYWAVFGELPGFLGELKH